MAHTLTIQLSDTIFDHLQRASELAKQPVEKVVEQSLLQGLPALFDEIPAIYQKDVYPLLEMSAKELQREALRRFPAKQWSEYEQLLEKRKEGILTQTEQNKLDRLRRDADVLSFRKGYAMVLLKRLGYQPPTLQQLSHSV